MPGGLVGVGEFAEESHIVFGEQAQVVDAVFQVGDAFDTHSECETVVFF